MKYRILAITLPLVLLFDQWSKCEIVARYKVGETKPIINGFFNFTYVRNAGAAFSFLNDAPASFREPFFLIVPFLILTVLIVVFIKLSSKRWVTALALSLIGSGAIGNLIDRLRFGYVVDFLHFYWKSYYWPMFNIADSCIVVGVGILFLESFKKSPGAAK